MNIRDLFQYQGQQGPKSTVLLGKAGMGKTTLAHWLCQKWADGQLDRFQAVFLFEFRQAQPDHRFLTLPQLPFRCAPEARGQPGGRLQHLKENAEESC